MRNAWLLGVFFFVPVTAGAAAARPPDFKVVAGADGAPQIVPVSLPERASPDPLDAGVSLAVYEPRLPGAGSAIRIKTARRAARPAPQAPALQPAVADPESTAEIERLGEDLRDAVAPLPSLEWFLAAIRNPDPRQRGAAVDAFGYPKNFAAIPYVSAVLLRMDEDPAVRVAAARSLGRIGDRRAWRFLAQAVGDNDRQVRLSAALALGSVTDGVGASFISRALEREADEKVRSALSWALAKASAPEF